MRYVRLDKMREEGLTTDQMLSALTLAINDLGIMMGLQVIHGSRAPRVYADHGGMVRFDHDGNVMVPVPDGDEPDKAEEASTSDPHGAAR
jgi:hypothetical protein